MEVEGGATITKMYNQLRPDEVIDPLSSEGRGRAHAAELLGKAEPAGVNCCFVDCVVAQEESSSLESVHRYSSQGTIATTAATFPRHKVISRCTISRQIRRTHKPSVQTHKISRQPRRTIKPSAVARVVRPDTHISRQIRRT